MYDYFYIESFSFITNIYIFTDNIYMLARYSLDLIRKRFMTDEDILRNYELLHFLSSVHQYHCNRYKYIYWKNTAAVGTPPRT